MAEGFEAFHVPQQSRRDKLRVLGGGAGPSPSPTQRQTHPLAQPSSANHHLQVCSTSLLPLYDPLFVANSDFPSHNFHGEIVSATGEGCRGQATAGSSKVEGGTDLMGFVGATVHSGSSSSSSSISHHPYFDPDTLPINPGLIQTFGSNPFLCTPHNLREFEQNYNGDEVMIYRPEPLSLSLSSRNTHHRNLPLEMNLQRYGSTIYGDKANDGVYGIPGKKFGTITGSASNEVSRSLVPLGPFTGYASIMKQSRFLKPAQQLLEELCYVNGGNYTIYPEKLAADASLMESSPPTDTFDSAGDVTNESLTGRDGGGARSKKSRLLTMLDEIYRKYKQYYQQMQAVVSSFEYVAGLGNAAPYANLAVKAMSKHFRCLKNAISDQLQFSNNSNLLVSHRKDASPPTLIESKGDMYVHKSAQSARLLDHQSVWRPHRGLPERAVTVLRAWLFEHFLHPYPTDADKLMLAKLTGLSRNQVSNWFINARVRLWKPMVEEIHTLETRQAQKSSQKDDDETGKRSADHVSDNPSTSADRVYDFPFKRNANELRTGMSMRREEPINPTHNSLSSTQPLGVNVGIGSGSGSSVSLTLGLHHNHHQIGLSEPFPASAVQRFGLTLEPNSETYVMGGFDSQNRHFGRDVMEGQLLHDFVR